MAKLSTEDLLAQFEEMTLIELSEFVKAFVDKFDVTAAAPMAVAAAGAPAGQQPSDPLGDLVGALVTRRSAVASG